jgi:predicted nucleotidyltransferase
MMPSLKHRIVGVLERHPEIVGAYLFGSRSRNEETPASDVDVAVLYERPRPLISLIELQDELERAAGVHLDLIDVARADAFLALDVIRGERIFERDGRRLDEFDLYVLRRAGDLAPFEYERRRALLTTEPT